MKIQLKRSNVLELDQAKAPTASQMEYGELAVNYNTNDPVLFIKDSADQIIRLTNRDEIPQVEAGDGLESDVVGNTVTLSVVAEPGYGIAVTAAGVRLGDEWTNIPALPTVAR